MDLHPQGARLTAPMRQTLFYLFLELVLSMRQGLEPIRTSHQFQSRLHSVILVEPRPSPQVPQRQGHRTEKRNPTNILNRSPLARVMEYPRVVFGSTQTLDRAMLEEMGFLTEIIGTKRLV
jgi:hypothetical protein